MRARLLALGRQTVVYGLGGVAVQAVGLVTLPVYARKLTPVDYGILELLNVGVAAVMVVADLGLSSAMQRNYYDHPAEDRAGRLTVTSTAIGTSVLLAAAIASIIVALRAPLSSVLFETSRHADLVALAALTIPLFVVANLFREVMRLRFRAGHFVTSAGLGASVAGFGGVLAVTALDSGVAGILVAGLAGFAVAGVYGVAVGRHDVGLKYSRDELRSLLRYGVPLVPAGAALWALSFLDRVMLSRLTTLGDTGEFAVATRFSSVLMFVVVAFANAYSPFLFSLHADDPDTEKVVRARLLTYVSIILVGLALALGLFARDLARVVTPGFVHAYEAVGLLSLGVAAYGVSNVTLAGISLARRTPSIALFTGIAVILNVVLNLALIPQLGIAGAAMATMAAYMLLAVAYYAWSQRVFPTPFEPVKAVTVFVVGGALMPVGLIHTGGSVGSAIRLAALVAFAAALVALRVVDRTELAELRQLLSQRSGPAPP